MSKQNKDAVILGFAMFSMFFGAGNLIFPPYLGIISGSNWLISGIAFAITGVGLTMLGVVTTAKFGGDVDALASKVSPNFAKIFGSLCMIAIGPLLAIPRTAATTYSITVSPILKNVPPLLVSVIFFAITLYFLLNKNTMMDTVGKILTPILLIMVFLIITKAIITPIGQIKIIENTNFFLKGFNEGYQTMDALGSMFVCSIFIKSLVAKGYTSDKEKFEMGTKVGFIAGLGLSLVYISLCFVGATATNVINTTDKADILIGITTLLWGKLGSYTLGVAMLMACLTTSIGLSSAVASYFEDIFNKKISYDMLCIIICIFSTIASIFGLEKLINIAVPILITLYPMMIVLLIANIFDKYIKNKSIYTGAVIGAFIVSFTQAISIVFSDSITLKNINDFISSLPFAKIGMPYIIPSILMAIIFAFLVKNKTILSNS